MNRLYFLSIVILLGCAPADPTSSDYNESKLSTNNSIASEPVEKHKKIPESVVNSIEPSIKDWLQFYNLNIFDFYYIFQNEDDCQEIYLTDRKKETTTMVLWLGSQEFAEAVFWLDENNFIVVGKKYDNVYFISTFGDNRRDYEFKATTSFPDRSYFEKNLESRGVHVSH